MKQYLVVVNKSFYVGNYGSRIVQPIKSMVVNFEQAKSYSEYADWDNGEESYLLGWNNGESYQLTQQEWDEIEEKR